MPRNSSGASTSTPIYGTPNTPTWYDRTNKFSKAIKPVMLVLGLGLGP